MKIKYNIYDTKNNKLLHTIECDEFYLSNENYVFFNKTTSFFGHDKTVAMMSSKKVYVIQQN